MTTPPDLRYLLVELAECQHHFWRYLFGQLDVGLSVQEQSNHQIFVAGQVNQVFIVVVVDCSDSWVGLGLGQTQRTFIRLAWAWLMALMSMEVACTNF